MKTNKKKRIVYILAIEAVVFMYGYWCGSRGLLVLHRQHRRNDELALHVAQLRNANASLKQELLTWQTDPFYKERYAREVLQMARADEMVYFLPS